MNPNDMEMKSQKSDHQNSNDSQDDEVDPKSQLMVSKKHDFTPSNNLSIPDQKNFRPYPEKTPDQGKNYSCSSVELTDSTEKLKRKKCCCCSECQLDEKDKIEHDFS